MAQIVQTAGMAALSKRGAKSSFLTVALRVASVWSDRRRTRIALTTLTEAQLRDIGLEREAALEEAQRPFWLP